MYAQFSLAHKKNMCHLYKILYVASSLLFLFFMQSYAEIPRLPQPDSPLPQAKNPEEKVLEQQSPQQSLLDINIPTSLISGKNEITVCASMPLKGEAGVMGKDVFDGINLFFNKIKKAPLPFLYTFDALDDRAEITQTRTNLKKLSKKSPLFFSLLENEALQTLKEVTTLQQLLLLFPLNGSSMHRNGQSLNTVFFRASHEQELDALISYSINVLNQKKISIFYEASEWGEDALVSAKKILALHDLTPAAESSYQQNSINIARAAQDIANSAPDAIICIALSRPAYNFIRQIINKGLYKTTILGISTLSTIQKPLKRSRGIKIVISSVVPDPKLSSLKIATEYRTDLAQYFGNKQPTPFSFEGYINAALLSEYTKLVQFPCTIKNFMSSIENLGKVNFKGLTLSFDSNTRSLSNAVWLNIGEDKEWELYKPTNKTESSSKES